MTEPRPRLAAPRVPEVAPGLFGALPAPLFRLLSGTARWFYADLLEFLAREVFSVTAGTVRQRDSVEAIGEFIDRQGRGEVVVQEANDSADRPIGGGAAGTAYARLVETGWLIEQRDRYRRTVDLDANARLLLELLLDIKDGSVRSYGGEVLQVFSALEAVRINPAERSQGIRNAARSAKSFMNHLRAVAGALRAVEQTISARAELAAMFQDFFENFVARHLIEDYKRLHTQSNPFRFRIEIIACAEAILLDETMLAELAGGYCREGRSLDHAAAHDAIEAELRLVLNVFGALDEHLDVIENISLDMERRLRNTVRHLERVTAADPASVAAAMRALGGCAADSVPAGPLPLLSPSLPLGSTHMFQAARRRALPARRPVLVPQADAAFLAFQEARLEFQARVTVTAEKIGAWLESALAGRDAADAADLPLNSLDDFIIFERLPLLRGIDPALAAAFDVRPRSGALFISPWITCVDFQVRRVPGGSV